MIRSLRHLTESRIRAAEAAGELRGLAGEGKPLPDRSGEAHLDTGTQVGHRIMAEAGALPEEFRIKRRLDAARAALAAARDPQERRRLQAEAADLELRHAIATEARRKFLRP
ncbi:DnaJ family domain-containing protein [Limimaricola pyoseonensis]|uniref:DnaJ homologue subfamily C member 28 conserved domain-containing protein n=1 Tax=Limimaricola pyoseonensis TaxID=521013 RepID=A0A1G7D224_9RHOB|nr:DnaJ family domain-containing protein [Limimaricola pyoseonensis]SDE45652.1 protein of unknown function [Limimaricola pyoseonensis]